MTPIKRKLRNYLIYAAGESIPATQVVEKNIRLIGGSINGLYLFPLNWYPLTGINQCVFRWYVQTMPTGATYLDITPISFESFFPYNETATGTDYLGTGYARAGGAGRNAFTRLRFDSFDTTTGFVTTYPYRFRKTTADAGLTVNTDTWRQGTRHAFPMEEDYVGFIVQSDGTDNTGTQTLVADLGWA